MNPWQLPINLLGKIYACNRLSLALHRWRVAMGIKRYNKVVNELVYYIHRVVDIRDFHNWSEHKLLLMFAINNGRATMQDG